MKCMPWLRHVSNSKYGLHIEMCQTTHPFLLHYTTNNKVNRKINPINSLITCQVTYHEIRKKKVKLRLQQSDNIHLGLFITKIY